MQRWCIEATKDKLGDIMDAVVKQHPNLRIRIAYVGYRDYGVPRFEIMPFTDRDPVTALRTFLKDVECIGNADLQENVCGGLQKVADLDWKASASYLKGYYLLTEWPQAAITCTAVLRTAMHAVLAWLSVTSPTRCRPRQQGTAASS